MAAEQSAGTKIVGSWSPCPPPAHKGDWSMWRWELSQAIDAAVSEALEKAAKKLDEQAAAHERNSKMMDRKNQEKMALFIEENRRCASDVRRLRDSEHKGD